MHSPKAVKGRTRSTKRTRSLIAFACDVLRFEVAGSECTNFQFRNLEWIRELLTPSLLAAIPGVTLAEFLGPKTTDELQELMGGHSKFEAYRENAQIAWAKTYDSKNFGYVEWYLDQLCNSELIIGFELPPVIKRGIHSRGHRYLDLRIHPLRFLRDTCFSAATNDPLILAAISKTGIDSYEITHQLHRFRAMFKRKRKPAFAIPQGLPVLIGQTEFDSSLIQDGRFADWSDYVDLLRTKLNDFDSLVFMEHPSRPNSRRITEFLRFSLEKTIISTNVNSYGVLLSNNPISRVITLSSSLGVESEIMGIDTQFLLADPRNKFLVLDCDLDAGLPIGHGLFDPLFWAEIFNGDRGRSYLNKSSTDSFFLGNNYVRNTLDQWAYIDSHSDLDTLTGRKSLIPTSSLNSIYRDTILGGLMSYTAKPVVPTSLKQLMGTTGLHIELLDPPMELGEHRTVDFASDSSRYYFVAGFHPPEAWGCWSSELQSSISIPVSKRVVESRAILKLRLRVHIYDGLMSSAPVLQISHSEGTSGYVFFRPGMSVTHVVEVCVIANAPLMIFDFELSGLESPSALGESGDTRWLGFGIQEFEIFCETSTDPSNESQTYCGLTVWGFAPAPLTYDISDKNS